MSLIFSLFGVAFSGIAVALGAFGAHLLKSKIPTDHLAIFEVGVRNQMYHSLALILVGLYYQQNPNPWLNASGWVFIVGIVLFSGSLYTLSLTGIKQFGAITPIGGVLFLLGWLFFAISLKASP